MRLGEVLYEWRYGKRLSRTDAAKMIGAPESTLAQIEAGKDVTGKNLAIVLAWMMGEAEPGEAAPRLALEDQRPRTVNG